MMETMRRLALTMLLPAGLGVITMNASGGEGEALSAKAGCISTWSKLDYKSYGQVQADVRRQFGDVRILKVALCVHGAKSHFQIVVMDRKGVVRTLHIGAKQ